MGLGEELIVVSFNITKNLDVIIGEWREQKMRQNKCEGRIFPTIHSSHLGGQVSLVCPNQKGDELEELGCVDVRTPMGVHVNCKEAALYTASDHWFFKISGGCIVGKFDNHLFNCLHGISPSLIDPNYIVFVASTGIDCVLEIDLRSVSVVRSVWNATINGFNRTPLDKKRVINQIDSYQCVEFATPNHTTHLNSVLNHKPGYLLVTLFHQGELIEINMSSGKHEKLLNGLKNPHGIRKFRENGYLLSDTGNNRVLVLDELFAIEKVINGGFSWVQDALQLADGTILLVDANNFRLVRVSPEGNIVKSIYHDKTKRIGGLGLINLEYAKKIFELTF